jgi:lipopolysaccharide transport system ATP-binding protein
MSDILVSVNNVSKKFCRRLRRSLWYGVKDLGSELIGRNNSHKDLRKDEFWAVQDVSFQLKRGETLGLIGPNGSGKTTLLRMINGLIKPDGGRIEVRGRVGALIALGAGFNPILTGRENIYVNASVLGIPKAEVNRKFDEIVDFSGIEEFIDAPVQSYSSGMAVRLGFAVAAHMNPDILLVDEVLAVGDMVFQAKCLSRISRLRGEGCTIILVSHNEEQIRRVCNRSILLNKGKTICLGDLNTCYANYHQLPHKEWIGEVQRAGNQKVEIREVEFLDDQRIQQVSFRVGQPMTLRVHLAPHEPIDDPAIDIGFNSNMGYVASSIHSKFSGQSLGRLEGPCIVEIYLPSLYLAPGGYRISAIITAADLLEIYDWRRNSWEITVEHSSYVRGAIYMPAKWRVLLSEEVTE